MNNINCHNNIIKDEDRFFVKRLVMLIVPAIIIGNIIHVDYIRPTLGILCIAAILLIRGTSLITVVIGIKPVMDLTWDATFFNIFGFQVNSIRIIAMIMFFIWGYLYITTSKKDIKNNKILTIFILYLIFSSFVKSLFIEDLKVIINNNILLIRILCGFFLYFIATKVYTDIHKRIRLIAVIWLSNLFVMLINLVVLLKGTFQIDISQGVERFNSVYNDPGGPAFVALTGVIFAILYVNLEKRKLPKLLSFAYICTHIFAIFTLYITMTRGVILTYVILYLIWYAYFKRKFIIVVPLLVLTAYFFYTSDERVHSRFETEVNYFLSDNKTFEMAERMGDGRIAHNIRHINLFNRDYKFEEKLFGRRPYGIHNEYLWFLLMFGVFGLFFYLLLIIKFIYLITVKYIKISKFYYKNRTLGILSFAIIAMWIATALWGSFITYTTFWWNLVLVLTIFLNIEKNDFNEEAPGRDKS